jgi:hypothetical protein
MTGGLLKEGAGGSCTGGATTGACIEGPVGTGAEGIGGASTEGTCPEGAMGISEVGACTEGAMGACTGQAREEAGGRGTKPDRGCLRAGAPKMGTGWEGTRAGRGPAAHCVPAGGSKTDDKSSLVRKPSSCVGGEGRRREKGNVVSLKTT